MNRPTDETVLGPEAGFGLIASAVPERGRVVLAVSGGPDSLALLVLAGENRERFASLLTDFLVVTVDHGLRPEAAGEARHVAMLAGAYGLPHRTLGWKAGAGRGNLSARAREARYGLLLGAARDFGAGSVLVAHHQDDQIETHLMARERGEGTMRLAGMRPRRDLAPGVALCRPFLGLPKTALTASLAARDIAWDDDPTNDDLRYARTRWRRFVAALPSADRRSILSRIADAQARRREIEAGIGALMPAVAVDGAGAISVDRRRLAEATPQVSAGLLARALAGAGGASRRATGDEVERLLARIRSFDETLAATLAGCRIAVGGPRIDIVREFGRKGPAPIDIAAGQRQIVFDDRFEIELPEGTEGGRLVPLGALGLGGVRDATLPVLLDRDGRPAAAHPAALARLARNIAPLACRERVTWRLTHDLPLRQDVIQIAAKAPEPVGKEMTADYLPG